MVKFWKFFFEHILFLLAGAFVLYLSYNRDNESKRYACEIQSNYKKIVLNGKVTNFFIDGRNHAYHTIVVDSIPLDFVFNGEASGLFGSIAVGDSIIKMSGTMSTVVINEYGEEVIYDVDFGGCEEEIKE